MKVQKKGKELIDYYKRLESEGGGEAWRPSH